MFNKKIFIQSQTGDTLLHLVIKHKISPNELRLFLNKIDNEEARQMATTINNHGFSPFHLINVNYTDINERNRIYNLVFPITIPETFKPMAESINFEQIINEYHPEPGSKLYFNLEKACEIANETRKKFKYSSSHPEINGTESENVLKLVNNIKNLHTKTDKKRQKILNEKTYVHENIFMSLLNNELKLFEENECGNCYEQSQEALKILCEKYNFIEATIYYIDKGDHAFVVMDPNSDAPVICDPWAGKVFPASALATELKAHFCVATNFPDGKSRFYNCPISFNPAYHSLQPLKILEIGHEPAELNYTPIKLVEKSLAEDIVEAITSLDSSVLYFLLDTTYGYKFLQDKTISQILLSTTDSTDNFKLESQALKTKINTYKNKQATNKFLEKFGLFNLIKNKENKQNERTKIRKYNI